MLLPPRRSMRWRDLAASASRMSMTPTPNEALAVAHAAIAERLNPTAPPSIPKPLAPWKAYLVSKNKYARPAKLEKRWRNAKRITRIEGNKQDFLACWCLMFQLMSWEVDLIHEGDEVSVSGLFGPIVPVSAHYCRVEGQRVLLAEVFWTIYERTKHGHKPERSA